MCFMLAFTSVYPSDPWFMFVRVLLMALLTPSGGALSKQTRFRWVGLIFINAYMPPTWYSADGALSQYCGRKMLLLVLHYIALDCIAFQCIVLHCIALHCIALHCIALHCIALHCIALHCIALHYIALHYIVLHFNALGIVLHCISMHCITLYCIALH